jgi:peroxiredoxin
MAALGEGTKAPDFSLPASGWRQRFSLQEALQRGPVLAAFFKVSCPVCQYAFPFFERLHKAYGSEKVAIVAVSQDDKNNTAAFLKEYGVTFPRAARRSRRLRGFQRIRPHQRAVMVPHRAGWRDQNLQRRLGKSGRGRSEPPLADANHTALRRLFLPEMTSATPALVEAPRTDPAVAGRKG